MIRAREDGVELVEMKWGFKPARPKAPPVINFLSEGRRFGQGRCLILASCFFEFTGSAIPRRAGASPWPASPGSAWPACGRRAEEGGRRASPC
ncbi:MAG: hypothetical protein WDM85_18330 [Caulobacteraceae bacterium]